MRTTYQRRVTALISGAAAFILGSSTVLAGDGFAPTVVLRTAPDDRLLNVQDIAAKGANVGVVWQEQDDDPRFPATDPRLRVRISNNGGQTFQATELLDTRELKEASADVCDGFLWVASALHRAEDPDSIWNIVLDGVDLDGSVRSGRLITLDDPDAHFPDVACIGDRRHIIAWAENEPGTDSLPIRFIPTAEDLKDPMPEYDFGPYAANAGSGLSVAATNTRAYAVWVRPGPGGAEGQMRFKRFDIGTGPNAVVTGHPIITIPDMLDAGGQPKLAARGMTVILAYSQEADLFVRRSTDGGFSFGPRERLIDAPFPSEVFAYAESVDILGSSAVINATVLGGVFEIGATQFRIRSSDGGDTWTGQDLEDQVGTRGERVGAYSRLGGQKRLVEAWDRFWDADAAQKLRFHRED